MIVPLVIPLLFLLMSDDNSVLDKSACQTVPTDLPMHEIISLEKAQRMAEFFGVLGDPNRWRILSVLALGERRVRDLAVAVGMTESAHLLVIQLLADISEKNL